MVRAVKGGGVGTGRLGGVVYGVLILCYVWIGVGLIMVTCLIGVMGACCSFP